MIPDWQTNRLFVSDRLEVKFPTLYAQLKSIFAEIEIIPGTSDIWCRDYMPIQLGENTFCQFIYRPDYLKGYEHLATPPERCQLPFMENYESEPLVIDGGNVVASHTKVILTEKTYKENPIIERSRLRSRLEELFQADCIFIPKEPGDPIGHADGVVRFIAEDRVLISDYSILDPAYGDKLRALLERSGLIR